MKNLALEANSYFDGQTYHDSGPYNVLVKHGRIQSVQQARSVIAGTTATMQGVEKLSVEFLMPGMVEAHSHLFLDGAELDFNVRSEYLKAPLSRMLEVARNNARANLASGITLVRDAGDRYGVNHAIREEYRTRGLAPVIRSPGLGLRRPNKYGAFMATEVASAAEITAAIAHAASDADDLKVLLTGIIDFEAGTVTTPPQFDLESLRLIVSCAAENGLKTFAHCSGLDGLELAVAAGVDSVEHGFFMTESILDVMAQKGIAWVPTFSPVHVQWARPELAGWKDNTVANLRCILDGHLRHVEMAYHKGVPVVAGSDAGSYGVPHGASLINELIFFLDAGLPMREVLESVTSRPRRLWGSEPAEIRVGNVANLVALGASPFEQPEALRQVRMVLSGGSLLHNDPSCEKSA